MKELVPVGKVLKWYGINQNNSGGYTILNDIVGSDIFVQAYSAQEATKILEDLVECYSEYCSCCGERWYIWLTDNDGYDVPTKYGKSLADEDYETFEDDGYAVLYWHSGLVDKLHNGKRFIE